MVLPCMRSRLIRMRVSASCFQSSTPLVPQICSFDSLSMTYMFDTTGVLQRTDFSRFSQASTSGLSSGCTQTSGLLRGCPRSSGLAVAAGLRCTDSSCSSQASTSGPSSGDTQISGLLRGCSGSSGLSVATGFPRAHPQVLHRGVWLP